MKYNSASTATFLNYKSPDYYTTAICEEKTSFDTERNKITTNISIPLPLNDSFVSRSYQIDPNAASLKSNTSNERRNHIYVHHFDKTHSKTSNDSDKNVWKGGDKIHQHMYKHEFNAGGRYHSKFNTMRKQIFDSLTLRNKNDVNNSDRSSKDSSQSSEKDEHSPKHGKSPSRKPTKANKIILIKPEHKAAMDRLEETYWAKWKPRKLQPTKIVQPKTKGLYTENETIVRPCDAMRKSVRKGRGDNSQVAAVLLRKVEPQTTNLLTFVEMEDKEKTSPQTLEKEKKDDYRDEPKNDDNTLISQDLDSEGNLIGLKHTDSFILTAKKCSEIKPHYQQPKCIRLFKNSGYCPSTSLYYIKGGCYPLRSCLRKDQNFPNVSPFGKPGSPLKGLMRKKEKANRFTK